MLPALVTTLEALRDDLSFAIRRRRGRSLSLLSRGLFALAVHRLDHELAARPRNSSTRAGGIVEVLLMAARFTSAVLSKCQITSDTCMERGVYLSERGNIVVGAARIGAGTVIHDRVTIGARGTDRGLPEIRRGVWIGPGSVIYGHISVGDGATILPDTVVSGSVPDGAVVAGNPARLVRLGFDNSALLRSPTDSEMIRAILERPGA